MTPKERETAIRDGIQWHSSCRMVQFANNERLPLRGHWRSCSRIGKIEPFENSYGEMIATDGILCYIRTANGLFLGHLQWFVDDKPTQESKTPVRSRGRSSKFVNITEYE